MSPQPPRSTLSSSSAASDVYKRQGIAISSAIVSFTLAATGYIANAIGQEPQAVITGITVARFVVPVICGIVIILALVKYPITDEIRQKVRAVYEKQHTENK